MPPCVGTERRASISSDPGGPRGDHRRDSDLDLFIDHDPETKVPNIFRLMQLEDEISERLGVPVTITARGALHPLMKGDIEREAIRVL